MGRSYVKHEQLTEIYNFGRLKKEYQKPFFNLFDHRRQLDTEIKSNLKPNRKYLINKSEKAIVHFFHKVQAVHLSDNSIIFDPLSLHTASSSYF